MNECPFWYGRNQLQWTWRRKGGRHKSNSDHQKMQTCVQSHKDDNERLMKSKEQKEEFNMKLMKILDKIEKMLDKESGSKKSESHETPEEKGRSRSDRKHHHHSQRYSNKRAHRSSSPSLVRNHRRSRVDELKG
jgi:hypothetical protein